MIRGDDEPARTAPHVRGYDATPDSRDARRAENHISKIVVWESIVGAAQLERLFIKADCLIKKVQTHAVGPIVLPLLRIEVVVRASVIFVDVVSLNQYAFDSAPTSRPRAFSRHVPGAYSPEICFASCAKSARELSGIHVYIYFPSIARYFTLKDSILPIRFCYLVLSTFLK